MLVVKPENVGLQIVEAFDLTYASRPRFSLINCLRKSVQFLFSQVGLCALVVLYAFVGGIVFQHLEQTNEIHECKTRASRYEGLENATVEQLQAIADNVISRDEVLSAFRQQLREFRTLLFLQVGGSEPSDCSERESKGDWTFPDAMLFSVTVFTTIGYGNVAPVTFWGRLVCICYSMLGIPLMLLCLGNLASVLGNAFRYVYSQMLCCGCCLPRRLASKGTLRRRPGVGAGTSENSNLMTPEQWRQNYDTERTTGDKRTLQQRLEMDLKTEDFEKQTETDDVEKIRDDDMETEIPRKDMENNLEGHGCGMKQNAIDAKSTTSHAHGESADGRKVSGMRIEENRGYGTTGRKVDGWTDGKTDGRRPSGKANDGRCADDVEQAESEPDEERVGIPLTVSLGIIAGYLLFGAVLYGVWETDWTALDSVYYCFVTISTIGFGDLVPGSAGFQTEGDGWRMVSASLYMLIGMALLSMCFNLMQDEIADKCRRLGQIIGLIDQ